MIPEELRKRPQWLVWRFETHEGDKKPRKVPYYVNNERRQGQQGSEHDRLKLVLFEAAFNHMTRAKYDGVGFAFLPGDGLIGIDLDNVIDVETGEIAERAIRIIEACASYTEYSPSGKGVHVFVLGTAVKSFKSNDIGVEVFCGSQFFTFTGRHYGGTPDTVNVVDDAVIRRLRATVDQAKGKRRSAAGAAPGPAPELEGRARVESALAVLSADTGYEEWLQIGMAVHAELGPGACDVWDYWSSKSAKYPGRKQLETHWKSFESGGGITGATLFKMARDAGWRPPGRPKASAQGSKRDDEPSADVPTEEAPSKKKARGFSWKAFFKRFTLIYPTETAWDAEKQKIVKLSAMRVMFGKGVVDFWLTSTDPRADLVRRAVDEDDVVFDPSCTCDPETTVNLFRGMPLKPDPTKSCEKLLKLLQYLCREEEDHNTPLSDWIQKWIAYPLQHPGAKMQTAVVMYGQEGTGKNLFWDAVARLYGDYGGFITQFQLQSQFNDWASRKMFIVANEVLTRMELRHMVGYMKNLITEKRIPIETKNMPVRTEDNHMQLVFLSNELQPLVVGPGDRRYMVVRTAPQREADYYRAVSAELDAGGVLGLYHYLLNLDLGDFTEHTKPPVNEAKKDLMQLGMTTPQLFWEEVKSGEIGLPYCPAYWEHLYQAYQIFCARNGDKNPLKQWQFSQSFSQMNGVLRKTCRITDPEKEISVDVQQRRIFLMGERPEGTTDDQWADKGAKQFYDAFRTYKLRGAPPSGEAAKDRARDE